MKTTLLSTIILSISEIQIHYKRPLYDSMKYITNADDADKILKEFTGKNRIDFKEFFWVILLNRANRVLGISEIAIGSSSGVSVNIREICQLALLTASTQLIVAHNHPSGKLTPSKADKNITAKIKKALALLDITLLDHIVITSEDFLSFANESLL